MMTRKQFTNIASAVAAVRDNVDDISQRGLMAKRDVTTAHTTLDAVAYLLAEVLRHEDPRFDKPRFLTACGVGV